MEFDVVAESHQDAQEHVRQPSTRWPYGTVHLKVSGADVTLCDEPVSRLVPVDPASVEEVDCWLCRNTAST